MELISVRRRPRGAWAVAAMLTIGALVQAAPAGADHEQAAGRVIVIKNFTQVGDYIGVQQSCGETCTVTVTLTKRDYGRFVRWCGTDSVVVTVTAGELYGSGAPCSGKGGMQMQAQAFLYNSNGTAETHANAVSVTVQVVRG